MEQFKDQSKLAASIQKLYEVKVEESMLSEKYIFINMMRQVISRSDLRNDRKQALNLQIEGYGILPNT